MHMSYEAAGFITTQKATAISSSCSCALTHTYEYADWTGLDWTGELRIADW